MGKAKSILSAMLLAVTFVANASIFDQDSTWRYMGEAAVTVSSSDHSPFWLTNNRMGLSSTDKSWGYLRAGFFKEMKYDRRFSWDAGVDIAGMYNASTPFTIQQLYAGVRWRSLNLTIGSKEYSSEIVDRNLSSGDLLFSGNAKPIPQVKISMPNYEYIPGTLHKLAFRGYLSYGMFTDGKWQKDFTRNQPPQRNEFPIYTRKVLFHSKGAFLRWGDTETFPLLIEGGLEMAAQFGGKVTVWRTVNGKRVKVEQNFYHGIKDYFKALIPLGGGGGDNVLDQSESTNAWGNHLGQWVAAVTWAPKGKDWSVKAYYEHFFEDHSMMFFDFAWKDMLLGFEAKLPKNPVVSKVVYEYLVTKDQSGPVYWDKTTEIPDQVSGRDGYYNHCIYSGWQHWGMGIGNPLVISPIYNKDGVLEFRHNRIKAHHIGLQGNPHRDLQYRMLLSFMRSWGTYGAPTPHITRDVNALIELTYSPARLPGWHGRLSLGIDGGELLGRNFGAMFTISKTGWL